MNLDTFVLVSVGIENCSDRALAFSDSGVECSVGVGARGGVIGAGEKAVRIVTLKGRR